jgi:excisionase family DNA binding protein
MNKTECGYLSINDFAKKIGVHPNSVRNMIKKGRLSTFRIGGGKTSSYRIPYSEIERLCLINLEEIIQKEVEKRIK